MSKRPWDTLRWDEPPYRPQDTQRRNCRSVVHEPRQEYAERLVFLDRYITCDIHGLDCVTVSMAAKHYGGKTTISLCCRSPSPHFVVMCGCCCVTDVKEYDVHNLFGHQEALLTKQALEVAPKWLVFGRFDGYCVVADRSREARVCA